MPTLRATGLGFTYSGSRSMALEGLDLEMGPGDLVVLAGPSGGGKSTAALGLAGLLGDPVEGDVSGAVALGGRSLLGPGASRATGAVGLVQQDPESHLCTLRVEDEVAFGPENLALPREEVVRRLEEALAAVGVGHLRTRGTSELSGGEKQRVAIASVLAMEPQALVMDEPTANLDPWSRREVLSLAVGLARAGDRAVVVAEHRLDVLVDVAREVVVLRGGRAAWRGRPSDLQADAEAVSALGVRVPGRPDLLGLRRAPAIPGEPVLSVSGLVSGYGTREVLTGVDLELAGGEAAALVGPNGGGKTTLLRCLLGLAPVWDGGFRVAGMDGVLEPTSRLARAVGLVFQTPDHQLFERTVRGELEFGPRNLGLMSPAIEVRSMELAREYALDGLLDVHPLRLSLGQKRRLNVASVQVSSPRLLLLDEPFIGQDMGSIRALNERLQAARSEGMGFLVVSHDLEALAATVDRVFVLEGGRCRELEDASSLAGGTPWGDDL